MLGGLQDGLKTSGISFMWIILALSMQISSIGRTLKSSASLTIFLCFRGSYILNSQQETVFGVQSRRFGGYKIKMTKIKLLIIKKKNNKYMFCIIVLVVCDWTEKSLLIVLSQWWGPIRAEEAPPDGADAGFHCCTLTQVLYFSSAFRYFSSLHYLLLYTSTILHLRGKYCTFSAVHLSDNLS